MPTPANPHDKFFRSSMQNKPIAKAFFRRYLPPNVLDALELKSLHLENSTYIDENLQETLSDLVFTCRYTDSDFSSNANVILLVERQSTAQKLLPLRIYHYLFNMLYRVLKERPKNQYEDRLPAVYALVFYHGKQTPYPYSMKLTDCFDDPCNLMQQIFTSEIPLVDLGQEKDNELMQQHLLGIMAMALKHSRDRDIRRYLTQLPNI